MSRHRLALMRQIITTQTIEIECELPDKAPWDMDWKNARAVAVATITDDDPRIHTTPEPVTTSWHTVLWQEIELQPPQHQPERLRCNRCGKTLDHGELNHADYCKANGGELLGR